MTNVLDVRDLRKTYGDTTAVDGISFAVGRNEIVGLLGPNGAGKTTTINMVLQILEPTSGLITIDGISAQGNRSTVLSRTNFAAVYAELPGNLTVRQNLRIFGLIYNVSSLSHRIEEVLDMFDLQKFGHTRCGLLSSGEQTRVALAKAILNKPKLLLLDEPTASLDPSSASIIREHIQSFAHGGESGVLWTSHNMHEVEDVCDRVLFLSHGKILLEGDPKILPAAHGKKDLEELFITVAREPLSLEND
jgi:ABC-2 type transport system ATP-binding protein